MPRLYRPEDRTAWEAWGMVCLTLAAIVLLLLLAELRTGQEPRWSRPAHVRAGDPC
jgi:hypothetical protein